MITQPLPVAGKLPTKTLVARQLPTHTQNLLVGVHEMHGQVHPNLLVVDLCSSLVSLTERREIAPRECSAIGAISSQLQYQRLFLRVRCEGGVIDCVISSASRSPPKVTL